MAMIKALIRIGRMECLSTSIFLKGGSRTIRDFESGCPGKAAGFGAHPWEGTHPSLSSDVIRKETCSSEWFYVVVACWTRDFDFKSHWLTVHRRKVCHIISLAAHNRSRHLTSCLGRATNTVIGVVLHVIPFSKPPQYDGKLGSVESHLTQFAIVAQRNHWDDGEKADYLMCLLTGEASNILKDLPENPSYEDVAACLRQHYGSVDQVEAYRAHLKNRRRRPGESLQDLMKDIRRIFLSAYPGPTIYMSEITLKDAFITALVDRDLMIKTMEREPKTLDEAYKVAERMELYRSIPETSEGER